MSRLRRHPIAVGALVALPLLAGACSQQAKAERDGRDLADSICDLRNATDANAANAAIADIDKQLDDIAKRYGVSTAEDRADIRENLSDLAEHAAQGNEILLQQDLTVLQRSANNVRDDAGEVQNAAWTGLVEGLSECASD